MNKSQGEQFLSLCAHRHSVRSYDPARPVDKALLERIIHAAQCGPSAGNLQGWRVHVVDCSKQPLSLRVRLYGARWFENVPTIIIFSALRLESSKKYKDRGRDLYSVQDATIAATLAMMEATALGLATCWLGAFNDTVAKEMLGMAPGRDEDPIILLTVGYEKPDPNALVDPNPLRPKPRKHDYEVTYL